MGLAGDSRAMRLLRVQCGTTGEEDVTQGWWVVEGCRGWDHPLPLPILH